MNSSWFGGSLLTGILAFGCREAPDMLETWNTDPNVLLKQCEATTSPELKTTCWVQLAATYGKLGKEFEFQGIKACAEIAKMPLSKEHPETQQVWEWECAFRLGEELAVAGALPEGLKHCSMAGRFSQNCITHAIWRSPTKEFVQSTLNVSKLWSFAQEQSHLAMNNLQKLPPQMQEDAFNQLQGVFGLNVYFGSGITNPEPAHLKDKWGASLRTGYAMERVRLATMDKERWSIEEIQALYDQILIDWKNNKTTTGDVHPNPWILGRYGDARLSPFEAHIPKLSLYGGGKRLIHEDVEVDMQIALLEAFFWYPHTPPAWFLSHLQHQEDHMRVTSAKLSCLSNALRMDIGNKLPNKQEVQWHIETCPLLR